MNSLKRPKPDFRQNLQAVNLQRVAKPFIGRLGPKIRNPKTQIELSLVTSAATSQRAVSSANDACSPYRTARP
jgi:hypothetical protein